LLRDVLRRHPEASLIVELKSPDPRLAGAVVDEIHAAGAVGRAGSNPERHGRPPVAMTKNSAERGRAGIILRVPRTAEGIHVQ